MTLTSTIRQRAAGLGFDYVGVTPLAPPVHGRKFVAWLNQGYHGEMDYMEQRADERLEPAAYAPGARSAIVLALRYARHAPPPEWESPAFGRIARYAWLPDYHDTIKRSLFELDAHIREHTGRTELGRACVDTSPVLERDQAFAGGIGFQGRNTCLIAPGDGSWLFLALLLVPEELEYDAAPAPVLGVAPAWEFGGRLGTCGACRRCLLACPTGAFAGSHILDSRRCISYLTIELRGPVPREIRPQMGNWVFGCDICQEVCPYNNEPLPPLPEPERAGRPLVQWLAMDDAEFRRLYRGTALFRTRRRSIVRNACIAAGNWGDPAALPMLIPLLEDPEPLVRGHAAWAAGRIGGRGVRAALSAALPREATEWVREELRAALDEMG